MKNETMVYTLSKSALLETLRLEYARVNDLKKYKEIKKVAFIIRAVEMLADGVSVRVEGVRGNVDGREMVNVGSVIECLVKHYRNGYDETWKTFSDESADVYNGFMNWEIKCSLPNARNTAIGEPKNLILINTVGAFIITKAASVNVPMDSNGKYYENMDYSAFTGCKHYKKMERALGIC